MARSVNVARTGDLPADIWLGANPGDESLDFWSRSFGWSGCLDAVDVVPAGGVLRVVIGGCYEGDAARLVERFPSGGV